jgi:hypothetical protein
MVKCRTDDSIALMVEIHVYVISTKRYHHSLELTVTAQLLKTEICFGNCSISKL